MILCVLVREYATCLERQSGGYGAHEPLMLLEYGKRGANVIAASLPARRAGVQPGLSLSRARAFCPDAIPLTVDPERYRATLDDLLQICWVYTNLVEVEERIFPNALLLYLDIGSLNASGVETFARGILQSFAALQLDAVVGCASGKFPAQIAAQMAKPGDFMYIPPGAEAKTVAPAPASLLPLSSEAARRLELLKLCTLEEFAALPRSAVLEHFGRGGGRLHRLAHGQDERGVRPRKMPVTESTFMYFDTPFVGRRRIRRVIFALAKRLTERLQRRVSAAHEFTLTITLDNHSVYRNQIYTLIPVETARGLAKTLFSLVKGMDVSLGIIEIHVELNHLVPATPQQLHLFTRRPHTTDILNLTTLLKRRYDAQVYEFEITDPNATMREEQYSLRRVESTAS